MRPHLQPQHRHIAAVHANAKQHAHSSWAGGCPCFVCPTPCQCRCSRWLRQRHGRLPATSMHMHFAVPSGPAERIHRHRHQLHRHRHGRKRCRVDAAAHAVIACTDRRMHYNSGHRVHLAACRRHQLLGRYTDSARTTRHAKSIARLSRRGPGNVCARCDCAPGDAAYRSMRWELRPHCPATRPQHLHTALRRWATSG